MDSKQIKQLAVDIVDGKVFVAQDKKTFVAFQVPLIFAKIENPEEIVFIYEYISSASPVSINGMPSFLSFRIFKKENFEEFEKYYKQYLEFKKNFTDD